MSPQGQKYEILTITSNSSPKFIREYVTKNGHFPYSIGFNMRTDDDMGDITDLGFGIFSILQRHFAGKKEK